MNSISFTGPTLDDIPISLSAAHQKVYMTILEHGRAGGEFHSGGATGIDTMAAKIAWALFPEAVHCLHIPVGCFWNKRLLDEMEFDEIIHVEGGYMKRNDSLVAAAGLLLAFPATENEVLRSGTWATIRRAQKANVPVIKVPLS